MQSGQRMPVQLTLSDLCGKVSASADGVIKVWQFVGKTCQLENGTCEIIGSIDFALDFVRLLLGESSDSESEAPIEWLLMHADEPQGSSRQISSPQVLGSSKFYMYFPPSSCACELVWRPNCLIKACSLPSFQISKQSCNFHLHAVAYLAQSITAST